MGQPFPQRPVGGSRPRRLWRHRATAGGRAALAPVPDPGRAARRGRVVRRASSPVTSPASDGAASPYSVAHLRHVRRPHYGRWLTAGLILVAFAAVVKAFVEGQIAWNVVAQFLTAQAILSGLGNTILMTICAMALGIVLGIVFAIMVMSPNPVLRSVSVFYIWFFRGTPLLLQLLLWFNLALVLPRLGIPGLFWFRTVDVMTPFVATL